MNCRNTVHVYINIFKRFNRDTCSRNCEPASHTCWNCSIVAAASSSHTVRSSMLTSPE